MSVFDVKSRRGVFGSYSSQIRTTTRNRLNEVIRICQENVLRGTKPCVCTGKILIPRVQQSLTTLTRRVIPGLSSISRANAGIIFIWTPPDGD